MNASPPSLSAFTKSERRLIRRLRTPNDVQRFLNRLPYNTEARGETLRSFRQVARRRIAHCAEAALFAAGILEQHGYPPLILSIESADFLDHVIFLYRRRGLWGTIARSRDPGLHGRRPVFRSVRALAMSYIDEYVDATGCIEGFAHIDLRRFPKIDWRFSKKNLWALERALIDLRHTRIKVPRARIRKMRALYLAYRELGRVVRSVFLLKYISDKQFREEIHANTNKVESFHHFAKWLNFGGEILQENDPEEQEKLIKYNNLVANALIFQNVIDQTHIIKNLMSEGFTVSPEDLKRLSPYQTAHVKRFGDYVVDLSQIPPPLDIEYTFSL